MSQRLYLLYFARLGEERGCASETLSSDAATAAELYAELQARHGFTLAPQHLRVAVNEEFCPWEQELHEGDTVVFLPPLQGG